MPEKNKLNLEKLRSYLGGNKTDVKDMVSLFLSIIPEQKRKMEKALKEQDWDTLNYISHQIKPSLDIFGLSGTKEKARVVESLAKTGDEVEVIKKIVAELTEELDIICKELRSRVDI